MPLQGVKIDLTSESVIAHIFNVKNCKFLHLAIAENDLLVSKLQEISLIYSNEKRLD